MAVKAFSKEVFLPSILYYAAFDINVWDQIALQIKRSPAFKDHEVQKSSQLYVLF